MSEDAMDVGVHGVEVKIESEDEVEPYDGSYACLICTDSVRGEPALVCWECNSNPWHRKCDKDSKLSRCAPHVIRCQ